MGGNRIRCRFFSNIWGLSEDEFNQIVGQMVIPAPARFRQYSSGEGSLGFRPVVSRGQQAEAMIGIVDYGAGNLASVRNAFDHLW